MPTPRDITGDLTRRPQQRLKSGEARPARPTARLRPMAFDPVLWLTGLAFLTALATQFALMLWLL
jgi:hypothetical protein